MPDNAVSNQFSSSSSQRFRRAALSAVSLGVSLTMVAPASSSAATAKSSSKKTKATATTKAGNASSTKTVPGRKTYPVKAPNSANPSLTQEVSNAYTQLGAPDLVRAAIGADQLLKAGITGKGVDVAVIDSGVARVKGLDQPGKIVGEFNSTKSSEGDGFGHGTHMAGIIAANDPEATGFHGVAPDAGIVAIKVSDGEGNTSVNEVVAGVDWVIANAHTGGRNIRVISLSLAAEPLPSYRDDPLAVALERAWHAGIFVVTSAGNGGTGALASPAYDPYILTVGAIDPHGTPDLADDTLADFTSGTTEPTARRADVAVPGVSILSLRSPGSHIDKNAGAGIVDDRIVRGSGTSQAAAVTAGASALLFQKFPNATPDEMKALMRETAQEMSKDRPRSGAGRLRLDKAVASGIVASTQSWPKAVGLPTTELDKMRSSVIKIGTGFSAQTMDPTGSSWTGNTWTGNTWTGNTWTGSSWTGSSWTGSSWTGSSWTGSSWTGSSWTGSSWTGSSWTGSSWTGSSWQ